MFGKKALGSKNWKKLLQNLPYGGVLIVEEEGKLTKTKQSEMPWCQGFLCDLLAAKLKATV